MKRPLKDKRPLSNKRPFGPFVFSSNSSRSLQPGIDFSDVNLSAHSQPATNCDLEVCFNGHSKEEVFKSIKESYLTHKDNFKQELIEAGINVEHIVITGSVVTGDFGCRGVSKSRNELEKLINVYQEPDFPENATDFLRTVKNKDSVVRMWEYAENNIDKIEEGPQTIEDPKTIILSDIENALCSDVDLFIVVEDEKAARRKWEKHEVLMARNQFSQKFGQDVKGDMPFIMNLIDQEAASGQLSPKVLMSEKGFNQIINKYYE